MTFTLTPQDYGTPLGAITHLSHQSQGTPTQQILGPTSLLPTHHLDLHLDPEAYVHLVTSKVHQQRPSTLQSTYTGTKFLQK